MRRKRRLGVEYLRNRTQARFVQVLSKAVEEGATALAAGAAMATTETASGSAEKSMGD